MGTGTESAPTAKGYNKVKTKVIHIITKLELGGAQQNTLFTLKNLDKKIFDLVLVSGTGGILDEEAKKIEGIKTYFVPELVREINPLKDLIALFKIIKILSKEKRLVAQNSQLQTQNPPTPPLEKGGKGGFEPEHRTQNVEPGESLTRPYPIIVHTHSSKSGIIGRWAAKFAGIPYIIHTFHGFGFNDYQIFFKRSLFISLERLTGKITSWFICVSKANIENGKKLGIFTDKEISLIRSGIEVEKFMNTANNSKATLASQQGGSVNENNSTPASLSKDLIPLSPPLVKGESGGFLEGIRERLGIKENIPIVGMIACFKPQKAPLDFIKIAARVKNELEAKFILVGDGELRKEIEAEIERLDLKGNVILTGWRKDIPDILKCFDLLVLTSLWEGLPRVLPEALASNIPVVATNVDGASEVIKDGVNGYLLTPHDIDGFTEKIVYLLKNRAVFTGLASKNRDILAEFDIKDMVKKQEQLYTTILSL